MWAGLWNAVRAGPRGVITISTRVSSRTPEPLDWGAVGPFPFFAFPFSEADTWARRIGDGGEGSNGTVAWGLGDFTSLSTFFAVFNDWLNTFDCSRYVYVCVCVGMCMCVCVCMCVLCVWACVCVHCVCACVCCVWACVCACVGGYVCTCVHICTQVWCVQDTCVCVVFIKLHASKHCIEGTNLFHHLWSHADDGCCHITSPDTSHDTSHHLTSPDTSHDTSHHLISSDTSHDTTHHLTHHLTHIT